MGFAVVCGLGIVIGWAQTDCANFCRTLCGYLSVEWLRAGLQAESCSCVLDCGLVTFVECGLGSGLSRAWMLCTVVWVGLLPGCVVG